MYRVPLPKANFTQMPNIFFDEVLREITNLAALKCYLVLIRKTWGYDKQCDWLSLSQFQEFSGLSRPSVIAGLNWLKQNEFIWRVSLGPNGKQQMIYFLYNESTAHIEKLVRDGELDPVMFRQFFT